MNSPEAMQEQLIEMRAAYFQRIADIQHQLSQKHSANAEDQSQEREDDVTLNSMLIETQHELAQVNHALQRIYERSYGICETCGVNIPDARLSVLPYATLCIVCAEKAGH